jgi:TPR repeat protein
MEVLIVPTNKLSYEDFQALDQANELTGEQLGDFVELIVKECFSASDANAQTIGLGFSEMVSLIRKYEGAEGRDYNANACFAKDQLFEFCSDTNVENNPAATCRLAMCYEMGWGTKPDIDHAKDLYQQAQTASNGTERLATMGLDRIEVQQQDQTAEGSEQAQTSESYQPPKP